MSTSPSPAFLFHKPFQDFDDLAATARAWDLQLNQLDLGRFDGELTQIVSNDAIFSHARFNRHLIQGGTPPKGLMTFALPGDTSQQFLWRGKTITSERIMQFPKGGELDAVSWTGFQVFTLSFSEEMFGETAERLEIPQALPLFKNRETCTPHPQALVALRNELQHFLVNIKSRSQQDLGMFAHEDWKHDFCTLLLSSIGYGCQNDSAPAPFLKHKALKRTEEYLTAFPHFPHTVRDLCHVSRVSERTLEYAFRERFGVPPKTYLQCMRLNGVRKTLRRADPNTETVTRIATRWGFWHMGQFSKDYKQLFGELPSTTLRRNLPSLK